MALGIILLVWFISMSIALLAIWLGLGGYTIACVWVGSVLASLLITYAKALCHLRKERRTDGGPTSKSRVLQLSKAEESELKFIESLS